MAFADVNLSEEQIRDAADGSPLSPGAGGWPTVRYFNKATGVAGAPYVMKQAGKKLCDELGDEEYMRAFVEEASGTSACSAADGAGCNDQQKEYAEKWKVKPAAEVASQLVRLEKMKGGAGAMKPDAATWLKQRIALLKQLAPTDGTAEL